MSLVIIEGLRFGGRVYAQVAKVDEADWTVLVAQRFLRRLLESTYPFSPERAGGTVFGLVGTATRLSFSASVSRIQGPGSFNHYDLFIAADRAHGHRQNLLLTWRVDRAVQEEREVLVENVARAEWDYFDVPCGAPAAWRTTWQGRHELPALVRVRVVFPEGDPRQWPDLIVAPRVTDDAAFSLHESADPACGTSK
jgi:general secretion pathway protein J